MKIREVAKHSPLHLQEGAISDKVIPGIGFADIGIRAAQDDYPGAAIAGAAAGLGLIPTPITRGASVGLDVFNQLRDLAKERGGWGNLGRDIYQSIKTQEYDPSFLPEEFANLDQLDRRGQLDEGGVRDVFTKYGPEAYQWLKQAITRKKPDVPTPKPPLSAAEREAAERAEELAAREAEKRTKVVDRRGQPKQDEVPIVNKDAPAAPTQSYPKYDPKVHGSKEEYLKNLTKDEFDRYKATQELLSKEGPVKPGWVRRAGQWVLDNKGKTAAALGTGYMVTPSYITDPVTDILKKATGTAAEITIDKAQKATQDALERNRQEKEKFERERGIREPDKSQQVTPDETPLERERREKGWPQSQLDTSPIAERRTIEQRYKDFLQEAETPKYTKEQYIGWAKQYAEQYKVPLPMVLHAMFKETGWLGDPERMRIATSPTGARGVMQIQPEYAEKGAYKIKVQDLTDPEKNIEAGVRGLAYFFNKYKSPVKALAAYNAGEGGAAAFLKTGDIRALRTQETRKYIKDYKEDVIHQLEKFFPKNKEKVAQIAADIVEPTNNTANNNKIAQVATDMLATVVGARNAGAATNAPQYPRAGTPIDQVALPGHWTNPVLQPQDGRVHMQLQDLSSSFRTALDKALADYQKDNPGAKITVTSGVRTPEDQKRLYAQAQAEKKKMDQGLPNKYRVTAAELAGHAGYAIDMNTADLAKLTRWLKKNDPKGTKYNLRSGFEFNDDVHLELRNWEQEDKARREFNAKQPKDKQIASAAEWEEYNRRIEQEKLALAQSKDRKLPDPGLGGAPEARADAKDSRPPKFPSIRSDIPSTDYQSQGDDTPAKSAEKKAEKPADKDKPKPKTRVTTDALGRETIYTQNEKGQWVDPRGNVMPTPEKPGSRKDLEITNKGGEPNAADVEKSRNITGRKDPLIDPDTGAPTTEKALRAKIEKRLADEKAEAEREAKRIADLEKAQRDAETKRKAEKPADKEVGKADAGTDRGAGKQTDVKPDPNAAKGLAGTDKGGDKKARVEPPKADAPASVSDKQKYKIDVRKEFERAFAAARADQALKTGKGSGGTFTWTNPLTGKEGVYTTDYGDEVKDKKSVKVVPKAEPKAEPKADTGADTYWVDPRSAKVPYDAIRKQVKPDYTVEPDPDALKVPSATKARNQVDIDRIINQVDDSGEDEIEKIIKSKPISVPTEKPADVLRSTDGTAVISGTGEPIGTGTSTKKDIERAKGELQKKIDDEKFKKELQKVSPDLSEPEQGNRWIDKWNQGIEALTGKERMTSDDMNRIRVPESLNTELNDILWLAGRVKR